MANGKKSVLSKDTIHLKHISLSFESIVIRDFLVGEGGGWIRPKQKYVANYMECY